MNDSYKFEKTLFLWVKVGEKHILDNVIHRNIICLKIKHSRKRNILFS